MPGDLPVRGGVKLEIVVGVTADADALEVELLDLPAFAALDVLQEDHAFSGTETCRTKGDAARSREAGQRPGLNKIPISSAPWPR